MAKLPKAKMEAGENPARSRHCKEGAFSKSKGIPPITDGIFEVTTEGAADKPCMTLGKVRKRDECQARRHAQMRHDQIHSIGGVQVDVFVTKKLNKQRKRAAVSRQIAEEDSSFLCAFDSTQGGTKTG